MAGETDFTPDEWLTVRRAITAAGVIVALAEGGGDDMLSEIFAVTQTIRGAGFGHGNRLVRELAAMPHFSTGLRPGMRSPEYEAESLPMIRAAAAIVRSRAPDDLNEWRGFVCELAETAARAHKEGGVAGIGGILVTAAEAAAIERVRQAAGLA